MTLQSTHQAATPGPSGEEQDLSGVSRSSPVPTAFWGSPRLPLPSVIHLLHLPLPGDETKGWKSYHCFRGSTPNLNTLSCHVSVLNTEKCPHPPHTHNEEEILLLLAGEVDLILPNAPDLNKNQRMRLKPGEFAYYPSGFFHTLQTVSDDPATYLMFKWYSSPTKTDTQLSFLHFSIFDSLKEHGTKGGFCTRRLLEGPTACLERLQCHVSTLAPGAGYDPHIDAYDVAIIVLEGEVETLGKRVGPFGVIFYRGDEPHGIFNPSPHIAKYVVFEFQGNQSRVNSHLPASVISFLTTRSILQRWRRRLQRFLLATGLK